MRNSENADMLNTEADKMVQIYAQRADALFNIISERLKQ